MKSNLDKIFKSDKGLEKDGVWFSYTETTSFLIRRFGGFNATKVKAALARYYKPYARLIEMGTLPEEKEKEIMVKVFVESSIVSWKGVEIDGKEVEFSVDAAVKLLTHLPELSESLLEYASDSKNYREDLGNS